MSRGKGKSTPKNTKRQGSFILPPAFAGASLPPRRRGSFEAIIKADQGEPAETTGHGSGACRLVARPSGHGIPSASICSVSLKYMFAVR
jgi:hypothetical protein